MRSPNEDIKFTLNAMQTNRLYKGNSIPMSHKIIAWSLVILMGAAFWGSVVYYFYGR